MVAILSHQREAILEAVQRMYSDVASRPERTFHFPTGRSACLFVGCAIGNVPIDKAVRTIWPFYLAILVTLAFITFVPAASLTLPALLETPAG